MSGYRGFPRKLHHEVPSWVEAGSLFHIRVSLDSSVAQPSLIEPQIAWPLLDSAQLYEERLRWQVGIFLLMPTHLHAILSFPADQQMRGIISDWKRFHSRKTGIFWQEGFFDHRLRDDEKGEQLSLKMAYIRQNPVVLRLCDRAEDWPWVYPKL
jgi:REP-associated tyrosine transposase